MFTELTPEEALELDEILSRARCGLASQIGTLSKDRERDAMTLAGTLLEAMVKLLEYW